VSELTDGSQNVAESYQYDAFGNLETPPATENSYTYTGREYDSETGLYFLRFRYYDPNIGRFITIDPIKFSGGINFYAYVRNNPIRFKDPFGLKVNCKVEWEYGGYTQLRTWIEEHINKLEYWTSLLECRLYQAGSAIGFGYSPGEARGEPEACKYAVTVYLMEEYCINIRYYEVCYDVCTGRKTSKIFLFEAQCGGGRGKAILDMWIAYRYH
jgi:RHS repeat-associated protein